MNKKIIGIFVFILMITSSIIIVTAEINSNNEKQVFMNYGSYYPDDFEIFIYCGSLVTWDLIYVLYINVTGESQYCILTPENRTTGYLTLISQFNFTNEEMDSIWDTIVVNDFFNLKNFYGNENVYDGTFANITITANQLTYSIQTENIKIDAFDNIIKNINTLTPDDNDLFYNAIFNHVPLKPDKPYGEVNGSIKNEYSFTSSGYDIDDDDIYFMFDWGDDTTSNWEGPYQSYENVTLKHSWKNKGEYNVKVKIIDDPNNDGDISDGNESLWSDSLVVSMPKNKCVNTNFLLEIINNFTLKFRFLMSLFNSNENSDIFTVYKGFKTVNNDGYDPNSGTRAKYENCEITIEWHITFYGDWIDNNTFVNDDLIVKVLDKIENDIEERWNRDKWDKDGKNGPDGEPPWRIQCKDDCTKHDPGCIVRFDANITYMAFTDKGDIPKGGEAQKPESEGSHWIYLNGPKKPKKAYVNSWGPDKKLPAPNNGMETTGEWNVNEDVSGVWAHECGHLGGLIDEYITIPLGLIIPDLPGFFWNIPVNFPLTDTIMADPSSYPTQELINQMVEKSGIKCPCECCPEVDKKKPETKIQKPGEGENVSNSVVIAGYADDGPDGSGVALLDYLLEWHDGSYDGGDLTIDPPLQYLSFELGPIYLNQYIEPGDWIKITIYATDAAGNTGSDSVTVTWQEEPEDTTPPVTEKTIGEPNDDGGYVIWPFTPITFEATDDISGVKYIYYEVWWDSNEDEIVDMLMAEKTIYDNIVTFSVDMYGILINTIELRWYAVDNVDNVEEMHYQQHYVTP